MSQTAVLIVEDEENLLEAVKYSFERAGYNVLSARDGEAAVTVARRMRPDLILLDVMLPNLDGFEVCRILRLETNAPILMLTARGEEADRIKGLELGADDYVTKPFSMRELLARVRNILKRTEPERTQERLTADRLELDLNSYAATLDGKPLALRPREFALLAMLIGNRGRALTRLQILEHLWGYDYIGDTRTVDVHIRWIREKIEADPFEAEDDCDRPRSRLQVRRMSLPVHWRVVLTLSLLMVAGLVGLSVYLGAQGHSARLIAAVWVWGAVLTVAAAAAAHYSISKTARSVSSVVDGARRLANGDLEHRIPSVPTSEAREMADSFNTMADTIRNMVRDLSGERNKLSAVLNTMADGVVVLEPGGTVVLMNQAAQWLLGIRTTDPVGIRLVERVRDSELIEVITVALESGQPRHGELEMLHRGSFVSVIATPLSGDGSEGVLLMLHDLSNLRQIETTRREFVSNVSHELRSPLASIKALTESLQDGALDEPEVAADFMERIQRDVARMGSLVDDLLALSRLESGQTPLNLGPLDIGALTEDLVESFSTRSNGVRIDQTMPADLPLVTGDEGMVRQVLVNLLENALKFTPDGGRIGVGAVAGDEFVEVRVKDTGAGIPPEHLPHVFERFYKVDRARRDGGTGLGLAIVKHIVQVHGGDVSVESREGAGSTFAFTLSRAA